MSIIILPRMTRSPLSLAASKPISQLSDSALLNDYGAALPPSKGAKFRGIDDEPADAKQIIFHRPRLWTPYWEKAGNPAIRQKWQKKDSGSARKEKQQIRENVPPPESP